MNSDNSLPKLAAPGHVEPLRHGLGPRRRAGAGPVSASTTMNSSTLLTCQSKHCDGYVFGGSGVEIVRLLKKGEEVESGNYFSWCKRCGRKYELRLARPEAA